MTGHIIVIEGPDGSGKRTQAELLKDLLFSRGRPAEIISFPQYGKKSAGPVEEYLNGTYGDPTTLNPYIASLLYAIDRFDASHKIRERVAAGAVVILDRYVDSNAAHQGGKILDKSTREAFLSWLYNLEYDMFGIPKPDLTIILHVPAEICRDLAKRKNARAYIRGGQRLDGHEINLEHLRAAENAYLWLAKRDPKHYRLIECVEDNELLPIEAIHKKILAIVEPLFSDA